VVDAMRILAFCGSLQHASKNRDLLRIAAATAPSSVEVRVFEGLGDLPHFNPDIETRGEVPESVTAWRRELAASDALLIACPEYGHSLPGVLKNAIDWVIGSGELERKVVAITAAVPGPGRGQRGLQALAQTLGAVSAVIVGGEPIPRGPEFDAAVEELVIRLVETFREVMQERAEED
jgi:chromate reductase, NAD(P)H dehydrogenase (quinone)